MLTVAQLQAVENPRLDVPGLTPPPGKEPRPYQVIDVAFLILRARAILAEYPGAGKKLIAIMSALKLFETFKARNALVVSLGADCSQWIEEIEEFTEGVTTQLYRGTPKERRWMISQGTQPDFRVCTYQTLVADAPALLNSHDIIILDEVSYIKNPETAAAASVRAVCAPSLDEQKAEFLAIYEAEARKLLAQGKAVKPLSWVPEGIPASYVWGLSATPYETSPIDIFSLFLAIMGESSPLGTDLRKFRHYCVINQFTVKVHRFDKRTKKRKVRKIKIEKVVGLHPEWVPYVSDQIREHFMRHPWSVVSPYLPKAAIYPRWLDLGKRQRDRYDEITNGNVIADYVFKEKGVKISQKQVTAALRLFYQMRCCDGLNSLPGQKHSDSIKHQEAMKLITGELGGEKIVYFSRYHQPLDDLERKLEDELIEWVRIDGTKTDEENDRARLAFKDPRGPRLCLMTMKGGYALNLQVARFMIFHNFVYNPMRIDQILGRIRRPGEHESVVGYALLAKDSSEEGQYITLRDRSAEADSLGLGLSEELFDKLTPEEQQAILLTGQA